MFRGASHKSLPRKGGPPRQPKGRRLKRVKSVADTEREKYEKENYRQNGVNAKGVLLKGATNQAYVKKTSPSMPSKFETVVYQSNHESKGFGAKSIRFQDYTSEDPGPGSY